MTAVPDSAEIPLWYTVAFEDGCFETVVESSLPDSYTYIEYGEQVLGFLQGEVPEIDSSIYFRRVWMDRPNGNEWWKLLPIRGWTE